MSLELSSETADLIERYMAAGRYATPDELLCDALDALRCRNELRDQIAVGIAELDRGERLPAEDVFRELREKLSGLNHRDP